ncbi:MAG TPA: anaerobic ribonucleoside-triphosphate reductase [Syntrophales bacterium]|nr:anaerobic ribonucleoside-triphosphate reductase [Syntrophales bacterium]HPQ42612.1 anaerobic ribonucleoside-triphosphate reductase [Syntrophales bacterium]
MAGNETTDIALFVRTSGEDITGWDRRKIVDALIREANVDLDTAEEISREVEDRIAASGSDILTSSLIRELVDARLIERGMKDATKLHARLGFPLYDVGQLMLYRNKENANIPHSPEGTNLTLAQGIKKEFAILNVFSEDVGYAHMTGDIHIHNLGYVDRPYCSCQSLEYIKKFGLNLPNSLAVAKPARHAEVLLSHMIRFAAALQGNFAGAIGWDAVNIFFAPYLEELSDGEVLQLAQRLIYEFAQQAVGRGGQTIFTDVHLYWEIPRHFEDTPAIGPGGTYTGKTYQEYEVHAQRFILAILETFRKGDAAGRPFVFPRPFVHITEKFFQTSGHDEFLTTVCEVAAEKGNPHFIFDRNGTLNLSECCSLNMNGREEREDATEPWKMRYFAIQNVSINLPRLGYKSEGDDSRLFAMISDIMDLTAKAHLQKRDFIEKLLSHGNDGPLSLLAMDYDHTPYLRMKRCTYLMGMIGLNELVWAHKGYQLHESEHARLFGRTVVAYMKDVADHLTEKHGIRFILEQSPAESTPYRLAWLDLKHYSPTAGHFVRGDLSKGNIYYTNSTSLSVSSPTDPFERVVLEGGLHPFIEGNTATCIWLGEVEPDKKSLTQFITKAFSETSNQHVAFSPEFTTCLNCNSTSKGMKDTCPRCGSNTVEGITKVAGYFSRISSWNRGKLAELNDRRSQSSICI